MEKTFVKIVKTDTLPLKDTAAQILAKVESEDHREVVCAAIAACLEDNQKSSLRSFEKLLGDQWGIQAKLMNLQPVKTHRDVMNHSKKLDTGKYHDGQSSELVMKKD